MLVAGASIAGPALAHWLRRRGAEVTVVERAPGLRPGGQAVDARGVTREVIRRMGLDAAVRAARTETAGAYTVDVDGKVLETYRADDDPRESQAASLIAYLSLQDPRLLASDLDLLRDLGVTAAPITSPGPGAPPPIECCMSGW